MCTMEAAAALVALSSPGTCRSPAPVARPGVLASRRPEFVSFDSKPRSSGRLLKHYTSFSAPEKGRRSRRIFSVRASSSPVDPPPSQIAPLQLESPVGQFLSRILISHPHLLPAAVDQQLQQLQTDRDEEKQKEPTTPGTDIVLYRRIAEVKANERERTLEEILYALVVQRFVDADVSLVPALSQPSDSPGKVDQWPPEEDKLQELHSPEAYEMIQNHVALILGNRLGEADTVAPPISKLRVGQVYAASIMYGYFLKRVDQRFQLEKNMRTLPSWGSEEEGSTWKQAMADETRPSVQVESPHPEIAELSSPGGFGFGIKSTKLRSYVMSFDPETLQRYATIRSKEAFGIIEKHTEALFGRPEIVITPRGTVDSSKDELIKISFAGLKRLILEAVTFGSFLWDVESYVDSRYHFVAT
uniref:UV-B-induced protein At3g17800, chloroplastic n=1 Tax=Anthurium amnicola TaxID=1678845 RepID=A0A1D1XMB5_9ARAE